MTKKTGAFRPLVGTKLALGGYDEDGVDLNIPDNMIASAKEKAKTEMRVAARIASIVPRDPRPPRRRAGAKSR